MIFFVTPIYRMVLPPTYQSTVIVYGTLGKNFMPIALKMAELLQFPYHYPPSSITAYHHPSLSLIAYHHPPSPITTYHHLSSSTTIGPFLIIGMMLRTCQKKFQVNWIRNDWDNEIRNLGAIQVYPMLSPKAGGGSQILHYQLESSTLKNHHKKFQLNRSRNGLVMFQYERP